MLRYISSYHYSPTMVDVSGSRILELALNISVSSAKIHNYLSEHALPLPSFDIESPTAILLSEEVESARSMALDASLELYNLLLGPKELLHNQVHNNLVSLHAISHYHIASAFPVGHEATFQEIASVCGLREPEVRRMLRHATTNHIFREVRKGIIVHTAASKLLAEDSQMQDWVSVNCDEMWPAAQRTVEALRKWPGSQEPNHTGFGLANNAEGSFYSEMIKHPERAKRFAGAMCTYSMGKGCELNDIVNCYPWESVQGTVVDVGGSHGEVSIALARAFPTLHFTVQDLPETITACVNTVPLDLASRVRFMAHDFFTVQPIKNADVYLFRWIFHNWPDEYCIRILRALIPALKDGARVVINEYCLPEPNMVPRETERHIRLMDICMLALQNSREREMDDWVDLLRRADLRFNLRGAIRPQRSKLHLLDVEWRE